MHFAIRRFCLLRRPLRRLRRRGFVLSILAFSGCVSSPVTPNRFDPISAVRRAALRERAGRSFAYARFWKPRGDMPAGLETNLAPLIVEQVGAPQFSANSPPPRFGAVVLEKDGSAFVDTTERVIYAGTSSVTIGTHDYRQVFYLWAYPCPGAKAAPVWRGIRATLGADGFPLVWEVYHSDLRERHLYVAASMEQASIPQNATAATASTFSVERVAGETPGSAVIRVLEDGPIPMGPYVLLSSGAREVTTLHCRCSPSQVDTFVESGYYDIVPVESLVPATLEWLPAPIDLSNLLRWKHGVD